MSYYKNTETGQIAWWNRSQGAGWIQISESETEAYKLSLAKDEKIRALKRSLEDYLLQGAEYKGNTYKLTEDVLNNIERKKDLSPADPTRYVFCNKDHQRVDFGDEACWTKFTEHINDEQNRVMLKYNDYRVEIDAIVISDQMTYIQAMSVLNSITFDFSN